MKSVKKLAVLGCALGILGLGAAVSSAATNWKFHLFTAPVNPATQAFQQFAKEVSDETNGELKIDVYPAQELPYPTTEMPMTVRKNHVQMADAYGGLVSGQLPIAGMFDLPFFVRTLDELNVAVETIKPKLENDLKKFKAKLLFYYTWPLQNIWTSVPVDSLAGLKNLKIRTNNLPQLNFVNQAGGAAVTMSPTEVAPAAQRHVLDGAITAGFAMYGVKWNEFLRYGYILNMHLAPSFIIVNENAYNALPENVRKVLDEKAAKYQQVMIDTFVKEDGSAMEALKADGVKMTFITDEDVKLAEGFAHKGWEEWNAKQKPEIQELFAKVRQALNK